MDEKARRLLKHPLLSSVFAAGRPKKVPLFWLMFDSSFVVSKQTDVKNKM